MPITQRKLETDTLPPHRTDKQPANVPNLAVAGGGAADDDTSLPPLRDDLNLIQGAAREDGSPTWTIHDPVRSQFFRVGQLEFEIISRWGAAGTAALVAAINRETAFETDSKQVRNVIQFLKMNCLLAPTDRDVQSHLRARFMRKKPGVLLWLLKNYLFIRLPLVRPDGFLTKTLPLAAVFAKRGVTVLIALLSFGGLFLVSRQWEAFTNTFLYFFTFEGLVFYGCAIFCVKIAHELGHAYAAKYFGLNVPSMGVAFLVLWPVLYSDNTEAWKLADKNDRLKIVAAGFLTEIALAGLATLLWSFLPDGMLKSAAFIVCTATWISSLMINLNPCMRFDGYYFLSDYWDVPNLQSRAFALGKWQLRRVLLGIDTPVPEYFPVGKRVRLILYAYVTWIYRLFLFVGIALMVYHLFFKVLGILLFTVEMVWFVLLPVYQEIRVWWQLRKDIRWGRCLAVTLLGLACMAGVMAVPWIAANRSQAVFRAETRTTLFSQGSGQLVDILAREGDHVARGDLLFRIQSPRLEHDIRQARADIRLLRSRLRRIVGRIDLLENQLVLEQLLIEALSTLDGLHRQQATLRISAPFSGTLRDVSEELRPGLWLNGKQPLATLVKEDRQVLVGYVAEEALAEVSPGDRGRFYPRGHETAPFDCYVAAVDKAGSRRISEPYFASIYDGTLSVTVGEQRELIAHQGLYRMVLKPADPAVLFDRVVTGTVVLKNRARSPLVRIWRRAASVLIRESGF